MCVSVFSWVYCSFFYDWSFVTDNYFIWITYIFYFLAMIKVTSFGRVIFSYSAIQPSFVINFPWSLGYIRKLVFGSPPWGKLIHSRLCVQPTYDALLYQTCTDTALSGYQFTPWSSGASGIHFLYPEKFTLGQCRIWNTDISTAKERATNGPKRPESKAERFWNVLFFGQNYYTNILRKYFNEKYNSNA